MINDILPSGSIWSITARGQGMAFDVDGADYDIMIDKNFIVVTIVSYNAITHYYRCLYDGRMFNVSKYLFDHVGNGTWYYRVNRIC